VEHLFDTGVGRLNASSCTSSFLSNDCIIIFLTAHRMS
jgi:hypothetical protein